MRKIILISIGILILSIILLAGCKNKIDVCDKSTGCDYYKCQMEKDLKICGGCSFTKVSVEIWKTCLIEEAIQKGIEVHIE